MAKSLEKQFRLEISAKEFNSLRKNPKFVLILQVARYVNQVNYLWSTLDAEEGKDFESSFLTRQTFNRLLFTSGVMYEMLRMATTLGREFRTYPSFQNGFQRLWKEKNTQFLKEHVLEKMRNHIAYHISRKPIEETLEWLEMSEYIFLRSDSKDWKDEHFQLADDIAFNFITGEFEKDEEQAKTFLDYVERMSKLVVDFNKSAHALIVEYTERKKWSLTGNPLAK